jgi:phosphinothricin acetyltransferase
MTAQNQTVHLREATRADLPAILEIYNHAVLHTTATADEEPRTLADRETWFDERQRLGFPIIVAEMEERGPVVGWGSLGPYHSRVGYKRTAENSIYIADHHKGKGVGTAILRELVDRARSLGMHAVVAVIAGDNDASVRLHAAFGFENYGRLPELIWKFDSWIDVVYMVKLLG